ncbi:MAG: class I SAM-dependent methyltransferase [Spirochaetaceae bacterium]|jgi:23S rRNA G2069 N7-methylase RlmK/C1962 C5-methylase RlmI|nr:class I SAM-dependent methyltransferase [Spirochaetaceae bacterium]
MLENRIRKRFKHLKKWAKRIGTDAFRLYDRDIPEIPLVIDYYGQWLSGAVYRRNYETDEEEERVWLEAMTQAVAAGLGVPSAQVFLKERKRQRGKAQYCKFGDTQAVRRVSEGGLIFEVNLSDYLDAGLFLDRRKLRDMIRRESAGKRVLNLFSYTCSFSVYAAAGRAETVDSVDLSNTYLDWGRRNFELNTFRTQRAAGYAKTLSSPYRLIRADAGEFLRQSIRERRTWDIIIADPPSFSNSKKMNGVFDIRRDYTRLISQSLEVLGASGTIWFSANAKTFRLNPAEFHGLRIEDVQSLITDEDFAGKRTPSCYKISRA